MTPHFSDAELACKCGCGMLPDPEFMARIEAVRVEAGFAMPVSSAARCAKHNAATSGTGFTGPHTTGRAIDFAVDRDRAYKVLAIAMRHGFTGIGIQQKGFGRFVHIDDLPNKTGQPRPTLWSYP